MQIFAKSPDDYVNQIPEERRKTVNELRKVIKANLPKGFVEEMSYGMIGFIVPFSIYPKGYHVTPKVPLPFMAVASQKNFIALYHMGIYGDEKLLKWFTEEYPKHSKTKLDMGKGCIRFKKPDQIPYKLIGELSSKISVQEWIATYESRYVNNKSTKK
ncbi:MAG: DUF1801 domain-containing protein [Bacteroidales bacterium]|nr:DUF1801 domain-containing protein [Bacteroidales bacterium]MBK7628131.1 DUF1801 domain-containing protein [Bacteroidales bacterium]